eukprot:1313750-Rhodomonas_salina.2
MCCESARTCAHTDARRRSFRGFGLPGSRFGLLGSRFGLLGSRFGLPGSRFGLPGSRCEPQPERPSTHPTLKVSDPISNTHQRLCAARRALFPSFSVTCWP